MRFAWKLDGPIDDAAGDAAAAEAYGFDAVWVGDDRIASTAVAASLAPSTIGLRVIVAATVGHDNPVELAEQVAVADLTLNGRLVLAVRPAVDAADRLGEVLDLLADCFGAHPFRHEGPVWPTPANLPANVFNLETEGARDAAAGAARAPAVGAGRRRARRRRRAGARCGLRCRRDRRRRGGVVGDDARGAGRRWPGGCAGRRTGWRRWSPASSPSTPR